MTNYEHYKDDIDKIWEAGCFATITLDGVRKCDNTPCSDCLFDGQRKCGIVMQQWLVSEYKESTKEDDDIDWSKVPVDTPILVKLHRDSDWTPRYLAKYKNGKIYTFFKGETSWSNSYDLLVQWDCAKLVKPDDMDKYRIKK